MQASTVLAARNTGVFQGEKVLDHTFASFPLYPRGPCSIARDDKSFYTQAVQLAAASAYLVALGIRYVPTAPNLQLAIFL